MVFYLRQPGDAPLASDEVFVDPYTGAVLGQRRWGEIGFVPIKQKDAIQKKYKAAVDALFNTLRGSERDRSMNRFREKVSTLKSAGSNRLLAFCYGTFPGAAPQLLAYTLYRWEMNIRMAAILGFVGAGGLGQLLYFELSLFHYAQASTVIIAMLLLSIAVDWSSAALRRAMR